MSIKVCRAALDENPVKPDDIILRGVIEPTHFSQLKTDDYQREVLPVSSLNGLVQAFMEGDSVPDIELGMRGYRTIERDGCFHLQDSVYIVDGLQRVSAGMIALGRGSTPWLGAMIHFGTTVEWERERFEILNASRTKLSSNVLLRNLRKDLLIVDMLVRLTDNPAFKLKGRISWQQRMLKADLISAMTLAQVVGRLHSHLGPTRHSRYSDLAYGLEKTMESTGRDIMRANTIQFFDLIDSCWGINSITFKEGAVHMRHSFLIAVAEMLSGHLDFWRDNRLFVEAPLARKLKQFPVNDPHVANLASSAGKARLMLVLLMVDHINSGKRTKRLTPRFHFPTEMVESDGDEQQAA